MMLPFDSRLDDVPDPHLDTLEQPLKPPIHRWGLASAPSKPRAGSPTSSFMTLAVTALRGLRAHRTLRMAVSIEAVGRLYANIEKDHIRGLRKSSPSPSAR